MYICLLCIWQFCIATETSFSVETELSVYTVKLAGQRCKDKTAMYVTDSFHGLEGCNFTTVAVVLI
jgi:hypothetical protein